MIHLQTVATIAVLIAGAALIDAQPGVRASCAAFYSSTIYPFALHRMAEPVLAVFAFLVWGILFTIVEATGVPRARVISSRRSASAPADATIPRVQHSSFIHGSVPSLLFWATSNIGLYLGLIDLFQRLISWEKFYSVDSEFPSAFRLLFEVAASVFLYDLLFYPIHRSFHSDKNSIWWKQLHYPHHDHYANPSEPLHYMVAFHHHLLDAGLQVAVNGLVQQTVFAYFLVSHRHTLSKLLHNIVVTYLLIEAHSGFDLPWMSHRILPDLLGGAPAHQRHHSTGGPSFHQFFRYLDPTPIPIPLHQTERTTRDKK